LTTSPIRERQFQLLVDGCLRLVITLELGDHRARLFVVRHVFKLLDSNAESGKEPDCGFADLGALLNLCLAGAGN
jgi:hypothetical protein